MPKPNWISRLISLQEEYKSVSGKTFFSDWDDFLFCKLSNLENQVDRPDASTIAHRKFVAIQWRNDHLSHCNEQCNVSFSDLLELAKAAGVNFTPDEEETFLSTSVMEY